MAITAAITNALILAETGGETATGSPFATLVPFLLIGLVFYFLIIRPQRKRQADQKALLRQLDIGDEIVTIGGFHGEVVALSDDTVDIEIAAGVIVTLARNAIARTINPTPVLDDADFDDSEFDDSSFDADAFDEDVDTEPVGEDTRDVDLDDGRDDR